MTVFKKSAALLVGLSILVTFFVPSPARASEPELRGVWVSTVYNLDYPSRAGLSKTELEQEADEIIENAAELGFNAVFFQAPAPILFSPPTYSLGAPLSPAFRDRPPTAALTPLAILPKNAMKRVSSSTAGSIPTA